MATKISWCDETINPVVGCSKISAGCQSCYAENMARRLAAMGMEQYRQVIQRNWPGVDKWNSKTAFVESELWKPHKWKKPRSIFISSMGDIFHDTANIKWQLEVLDVVYGCPQHTFIMLTKRPDNMKLVIDAYSEKNGVLPNLILGVSAENQSMADARIRTLLQIPAAKRFVSIEPMLEEVDLYCGGFSFLSPLFPPPGNKGGWKRGLDGVIIGAESGPKARHLNPEWVRVVRDQCISASVPFMFKQGFGEKFPIDRATGFPKIDGRIHTELPWSLRV